jgi:hypothetical protein
MAELNMGLPQPPNWPALRVLTIATMAQKPLALQGERSVTVHTSSAFFLELPDGLPRRLVCRVGASVVAAMMLQQPETPYGQILSQDCIPTESSIQGRDRRASLVT